MKRILALILALSLCLGCLLSCNDETPSESSSIPPSESSSPSEESSSSTSADSSSSSLSEPEPGVQAPNETAVQVKQTKKYYRQISSGYSRTTATSTGIHVDGQVFSDGVFEMNQTSQYKILSSHSELEAFSLLNYDEIESDLFEENRVVAVLEHHIGPSVDAKTPSGLYDIKLDGTNILEITMELFYTSLLSTSDIIDVYTLFFIVVPSVELEQISQGGSITIKREFLEQYTLNAYTIESVTDNTEAYYVESHETMKRLDLYSTISRLPSLSCPCIVIRLEESIETDFIVNSFKYENGEIYITVQIFDKEEMKEYYEFPNNLVVVSLPNYDKIEKPEGEGGAEGETSYDFPADSPINIVLEYVS